MTKHITSDPRPHFIPGIHAWLAENFAKVHVVVLTDHPQFVGPPGLPITQNLLAVANAEDPNSPIALTFNTVTLNLGLEAVGKFRQDEEGYEVEMRFAGTSRMLYIPFDAIVSVYTPDNQAVQAFQFILRPGQEEIAVGAVKKEVIAVGAVSASNDSPKPKSAFVNHAAHGQPRPSHLKLVKS